MNKDNSHDRNSVKPIDGELLEAINADRREITHKMREMLGIEEAFTDFCEYLDECGIGELYRSQMGGE